MDVEIFVWYEMTKKLSIYGVKVLEWHKKVENGTTLVIQPRVTYAYGKKVGASSKITTYGWKHYGWP